MAADKYKGPERRRYMRLGADCAVDYLRLSDDLKPLRDHISSGYTKNISASGINFVVPDRVSLDSFLEFHIKIPGAKKFITAIGKIIRCEAEGKRNFRIAASFIWINEKDKAAIDNYVKNKKLEDLRSEIEE